MPLASFLILWAGYSVLVDGLATVRGCNIKWSDIALPGRWAKAGGCKPDALSKTSFQVAAARAGNYAAAANP